MSEWYDNQKQSSGNFREFLKERINKTNPRRELTTEEEKRLARLEAIADKIKRGENVKNRQLQTWLTEDEYAQDIGSPKNTTHVGRVSLWICILSQKICDDR